MGVFTVRMKTHKREDITKDCPLIHSCIVHGNKPQVLHIVAGKRKEDHYVVTCGHDECSKITTLSAADAVCIWNSYNQPPKSKIPNRYCFANEYGKEVTVLSTADEWCMVSEEGKKKPYVLPLEYVTAIYNLQNQVNNL